MSVGYQVDREQRILRERIQARWMDAYAPTRHIDPVLIAVSLALTAIGILMVYSATFHNLELQGLPAGTFALKQVISLGVALVGMVIAAVLDYRYVRVYSPLIYVGALVLLGLVLTPLGTTINGSRSWIVIGSFQFQPSELMKVAMVVAAAALLHERKSDPGMLGIVGVLALAGIPSLLILAQPDLGTFLVFPWTAFVLLAIGGARMRYLIGLIGAGIIGVIGVLRVGILEDYQLARLTAFLDPSNAEFAQTSLYNTQQSMIAVGSGGFAGKGLFRGTQTNLAYVPENHSDFIFTVVGEEFGFIGSILVLGLFAVLLWRGLRIATMAKDLFGTLLATGAVAIITVQLFINVGMTIGISPVTGIPLPFVSYGGTSLIANFLLVGLMLNVHMRRF